ncbi:MAG: hypothetical protein CBARDMAM_6636 [uncultured Caballeronia sp.]|nr:MAG: hypothetical protein CBARDMAM_6636 [uncultured Caballeronia sp.]
MPVEARGCAYMIFVTLLLHMPCCAGAARELTSMRSSRCWQPIWAIASLPERSAICTRLPNRFRRSRCAPTPPSGTSFRGGTDHEADGFLHAREISFLTHYLATQRNLSPNTIKAYRDVFTLLLRFCRDVRGIALERLSLAQIDASLVEAVLDHLANDRHVSVSTRNHRLATLHAFFRYVQSEVPERLLQSGVPLEIIRDFLGHVDMKTTEIYVRANLEMKRKALEKAEDGTLLPKIPSWQQNKSLFEWLHSL